MQRVVPDYYKDFRCIADKCRHNCCIGWEIDIDADTASYYGTVTGDMERRLKKSIEFTDGEPRFILDQNERCPFLNNHNLCDIIKSLGEEHLCTICAEHPRFHNELPHRMESGLGLCCEEAARMILSKQEPVKLITEGTAECSDEIINLRDEVTAILQDRTLGIPERTERMLSRCNVSLPHRTVAQWAELLLSLERLDGEWTNLLTLLRDKGDKADMKAFDAHMINRQTEYEQLLVYLIYRHFANAPTVEQAGVRAGFSALCYTLIRRIGAVLLTENGRFSFEDQTDLCRMFSSEIEYSDENLYIILDELI